MDLNDKNLSKIYGTLLGISARANAAPVMTALCPSIVERDHAVVIARFETEKAEWVGSKQVVFMQTDGTLELWGTNAMAVVDKMDASQCQL